MTPRPAWLAALPALLGLVACQPGTPKPPTFLERLQKNPDGFVHAVAKARDLPVKRSVPIKLDDDAAFRKALAEKLRREEMPLVAGETVAFWMGFNFLDEGPEPPPTPPNPPRPEDDKLVDEQLLGFFDQSTEEVHVRVSKLKKEEAKDGEIHSEYVLAHEVGHALAFQSFGPIDLARLGDEDERLALFSLHEGDASMAGLAFIAKRRRVPLRRSITLLSKEMRQEILSPSRSDRRFRELAKAPPIEQDRLKFPYGAGLAFVGDLVRAGGTTLASRAFTRVPSTTEHILHPDKYLAGEPPIPVSPPRAPEGQKVVVSGRMGEFLTGVLLSRCTTREEGRKAAEGWGGDAYSLVIDEKTKSLRVLWSTVWDDEDAAKRFEHALANRPGCWSPRTRKGLTVSPEIRVVRDGTKVAFVRGFAPEEAEAQAKALFSTVGAKVASVPPFGPIKLPAPRPPIPPGTPAWRSIPGGYASDILGLSFPQPPSFSVSLEDKPAGATLKLSGKSFSLFLITVSNEEATPENHDASFRDLARALTEKGNLNLQVAGSGRTQLPIGAGDGRRYSVVGGTGGMQAVAVPICREQGSILVVTAWSDANGLQQAEWILANLRPLGEPLICAELDP